MNSDILANKLTKLKQNQGYSISDNEEVSSSNTNEDIQIIINHIDNNDNILNDYEQWYMLKYFLI